MFPRILLLDVPPALSNDDGELALVVELGSDVRVWVDGLIRADDRSCALGEDDGVLGDVVLAAAVPARLLELAVYSRSSSVFVGIREDDRRTHRACSR